MAYKSGHIYVIDHEPSEEELATFSKPVEFYICKPGTTEFYSILYTKAGDKFVEKASEIRTGFIKIGEIVQNGNQITIGVHPSGFNHWRINGVDVTTDQPSVLEIDPVADGEFRIDWIVGNSAGGLFILPGEAGKFPIKRNLLDYSNFAFFIEVQVTPDGIGGLVELNLSDVFTGNAADVELDIKEASAEQRGTMSSTHFSKLENINPSLYATLAGLDAEIVNRAAGDNNLQQQVTTLNNQKSSVVDKMLHYWDASVGKWLSSGIYYLTGKIGIGKTDPSEMLDVNGRAKATSYILAENISTSVPYEIARKGGKIGYAAADGIFKELAVLGNIFEHNVRGKVLTNSTTNGTFNCDLNAYTRWILTLTGNTTLAFTNMILADETVTVAMTVTGNFTLTFPTWLKMSPYSDIYDGTKINRIVIEIAVGGSSPSGWYSITKMDS